MNIDRTSLVAFMQKKVYKPLPEDELSNSLDVKGSEREEFTKLLNTLEQEGVIIRTRHGRLGLPAQMNLVVGTLQAQPQGFGFVVPDGDKSSGDIYVPAHSIAGAMHKDRVVVRVVRQAQNEMRAEGEIIRVLKRAYERVVGRFEGFAGEAGFVVPDEKRLTMDILIPKGKGGQAQGGDKVVANITRWPKGRQPAEGEIVEVLGKVGEPSVESRAVASQFGLPENFPPQVLAEVESIPKEVAEEQCKGRRDLRQLNMVTIDGADAKDLDDAVSIEKMDNGHYRLGVHIADVCHYVKAGTALDREALDRGTSIYLADGVIPMLPEALSNGICSINPKVDRLALSIFMDVNAEGTVVKHDITESVICTNERMTYDAVNSILLEEPADLMEMYAEQVESFRQMRELRDILLVRRQKRGAIDFDLSEAKIHLNDRGEVTDIVPRVKTLADSIIEEFMVLANETISEHFRWMEIPFMYRVHEEPSLDKIADLNIFLNNFGLKVRAGKDSVQPRAFQQVMDKLADRPEARLVNRLLLRNMMRARYSPDSLGHFGLAAEFYSHFTSPIRRYPDLAIHRIIKHMLHHGSMTEKQHQQFTAFVETAAKHSSEREQLATEAERAVESVKKALFMQNKVGEEFDGYISGVVSFGFFVELDNTVEGLVHVSSLDDDYYNFDPEAYALLGRRTKRRFRLGDKVRIVVSKVNTEEWTVDFELARENGN